MIALPHHFRLIYNVLFSIMMVIGVVGNVLVIMVILKMKDMRNSTNIFLANLAIADIGLLSFSATQDWFLINFEQNIANLHKGFCYSIAFVPDLVTFASVLTIIAVGFERYYAICQPLKVAYICTKRRAYRICLLVWALAALISSPQLSFATWMPENFVKGIYKEPCYYTSKYYLMKAYHITGHLVLFFLPFIVLTIIFLTIARHLGGAVAPGTNIVALRQRRHVIIMLATVVVCFFIFQMPYRLSNLYILLNPEDKSLTWGVEIQNSLKILGRMMIYLHSAVNPILYNLMSSRFREGFQKVCCLTKSSHNG